MLIWFISSAGACHTATQGLIQQNQNLYKQQVNDPYYCGVLGSTMGFE